MKENNLTDPYSLSQTDQYPLSQLACSPYLLYNHIRNYSPCNFRFIVLFDHIHSLSFSIRLDSDIYNIYNYNIFNNNSLLNEKKFNNI